MGEKASMWNLWHGCHKLSEGCRHCYVYRTDGKYGKDSSVVTKTEKFDLPLQRKKNGTYKIPSGNLVYTCFTSDFLIEDADEWRAEAWEMMRIRQDLRFLFITKRIDRLQQCLPPDWGDGYDNVTICCTMEWIIVYLFIKKSLLNIKSLSASRFLVGLISEVSWESGWNR